jgi:hypothetical protein
MERNMEVKNGSKTVTIPSVVMVVGLVTLGTIITDICNVRIANHKK